MATPTTSSSTLAVGGMTCAHCEIVVERVLRHQPGVHTVRARYGLGLATLSVDEGFSLEDADAALRKEGYSVRIADPAEAPGLARRTVEVLAAFAVIIAAVLLARRFVHLPAGISVSENMTLGLVFVIGLVASVSSCMAITGGLLLALAAKYNEMTVGGAAQRFLPHLSFNAGRLVGYAGFGALTGLVGSALMISPEVSAALTIAASVVMLAIGLQMLGLLPPLTHLLRMPRSLQHRVHDLVASKSGSAAFALGAATFFLPCGFTLALQLYVLAQGDPLHGALTMLVFALGTLPALLSLSMLSSFVTGRMQGYFLKLAGAAVIMLGFLNIQYGLVQAGSGYTPVTPFVAAQADAVAPAQARQVQVVEMTVNGLEYRPNRFTVKVGIPVEWRIDGRDAEGCGRILVARAIGVTKFLAADKPDTVTFTPNRTGDIAFNCSMGMMTPNSGFTVVE